MKDKSKILYERALITCLIMLFICIIFKLFGVQWFNLNTDIPILQEIDKIIMSNFVTITLYSYLLCCINFFFIMGVIFCKDFSTTFKMVVKYSPCLLILMIFKYLSNENIRFLLDLFYLIVIPIIENKNYKEKYLFRRIVVCIILNFFYQFISLFIRSISYSSGCYGFSKTFILSIDYYVLQAITYLYFRRYNLWIFQVSFSSLATKLWKKRSENYSNKGGK